MTAPLAADESAAPRPPRRRWARRVVVAVVALLVVSAPVTWSLAHALTAPGSDSVAARVAEWARDHHADWLVTWLEKRTYTPPKVGGRPSANSPLAGAGAPAVAHPSLPAPVVPPATPPLPGEGAWHVLASVRGAPALAAAYVRPDAAHTSYTAGLVWINSAAVRAVLHPGTQQPGGGPWPVGPLLTPAEHAGLLAAFNSAFRLSDARGGFYGWGRTLSPLRPGAASLVINANGTMALGAWGRDVSMRPGVSVVRQNLTLVVDHGRPSPGLASNANEQWGATLGNALYVWRSGLGVTAHGDFVFVAGNRLSAVSLADLMVRAGVVRGMELDINPEWTSFVLYRSPTGQPEERNVLPDMQRSPRRYDTTSSRDFVALYAR